MKNINMNRNSENKVNNTTTPVSNGRRAVLGKLGLGAISGVSIAAMPDKWLKPVVETVLLPAHAESTITTRSLPKCYPVAVRVFDFDSTPPSGGNASFKIELTSTAPDVENQVNVTASVDNGSLVGTVTGDLYVGNSLIFAWTGPGVSGIPVPNLPTQLTVDWLCANSQSGSNSYDLVDLVLQANANP